jgi:hypothetical protein
VPESRSSALCNGRLGLDLFGGVAPARGSS